MPYNFEEAWYDTTGPLYYGEDDNFQGTLAHVLVALPEKVRDYTLARCIIFSIGRGAAGIVWPARVAQSSRYRRPKWLIVISEEADDLESTIAHEIAHAWLRHDRMAEVTPREWEMEAANLARDWGFLGRGADPEFCASR
jgi:hypothetical protein